MPFTPFAPATDLALQASTALAGFALQNATPTILSWTVPNDGRLHRVSLVTGQHVTSAETGGAVVWSYVFPDGAPVGNVTVYAGGSAAGESAATFDRLVQPGSAVTIAQSTALTLGAALVWAQIWGD